MKKLALIVIIISLLPLVVKSQARVTNELKDRLKDQISFYDIQAEVKNYFAEKKLNLSPSDSLEKRSINRQFKFWNRWFYECESRLAPDGTVANWSKRMLEVDDALKTMLPQDDRAANSGWTLIGPTNVDVEDGIGRVLRLGFHPTNSQYIYAGTARGGLWRSTNGGTSWSSLSSFLPSLGVSGIEVSKTDPNDLYILTGEGDAWMSGGYTQKFGYTSYSNGVFKSTDGGSNWSQTAPFTQDTNQSRYVGFQLRQDPNNSSVYMAATSIGLYRTSNGASSWTAAQFYNANGKKISLLQETNAAIV